MRHPRHFALSDPERKLAIEADTGRVRSYGALEARANAIAHWLRAEGLVRGDTIAFLTRDRLELFDIAWAAQRSGLYFLPLYWGMTAGEAAWMTGHADSRVLFYEEHFASLALAISAALPGLALVRIDGEGDGSLEHIIGRMPSDPVADECRGLALQYTGGTTGRPKGVRRPITGAPIDTADILLPFALERFGFRDGMRFSTTAPMYHVAPLKLNMIVHALGGTSILLGEFEPRAALRALERYEVTHSHWVPHMMVALAKLPEHERAAHDLSSLEAAIHAAAPCPPSIKRDLIEWWGPIVHEIYAGTEGVGFCMIGAREWLERPGSVGPAAIGKLHVCRPDGSEADPGEVGAVWFEDPLPFSYHKQPERVAQVTNARGWVTMDDLGYLDEAGYLYLRDRKSTTLRLGDETIYPRVVEDELIAEPGILDVGVTTLEIGGRIALVAGYLANPQVGFSADTLPAKLLRRVRTLPESHRPARFVMCDPFPRDPDGKLDRKELAAQILSSIDT